MTSWMFTENKVLAPAKSAHNAISFYDIPTGAEMLKLATDGFYVR